MSAVAELKNSHTDIQKLIDDLQSSSSHVVVVLSSEDTHIRWTKAPGDFIHWDPRRTERLRDKTCKDSRITLLHELVHARDSINGTLDRSGSHIRKSELDAIRIENLYREKLGICPRTVYGKRSLPLNEMPAKPCPNPEDQMCRQFTSSCDAPSPAPAPPQQGKCCCWVYADMGKKGWTACVSDKLTLTQCVDLGKKKKGTSAFMQSAAALAAP